MTDSAGQDQDPPYYVAFAYVVRGVVERRRTPEEAWVREVFPVHIRSIPKTDAPTAMLLLDEGRPSRRRRASAGRLWRPVSHPAGRDRPVVVGDLSSLWGADDDPEAAIWTGNPLRDPAMPSGLTAPLCRTVDGFRFRDILYSGRTKAIRTLSRLALQSLIIDGELYQGAPEPTFIVTRETESRAISIDLCEGPRPIRDGASAVFRGDRHAEARAFAERVCSALRQATYCDAGSLRIVTPDSYAFRLDELGATTRQCFLSMLDQGFGAASGVEWLSVEQFSAWSRFRDAAARFLRQGEPTATAASAPLDALVELIEILPRDKQHAAAGFSHSIRTRASLPLLLRGEAVLSNTLEEDLAAFAMPSPQGS